jgi:hypothetical protein
MSYVAFYQRDQMGRDMPRVRTDSRAELRNLGAILRDT